MDQEKIWSHITRKISKEETEEDVQEVEKWLVEKPVNRKIYVRLQQLWNCTPHVQGSDSSLFEAIKRRIAVYENKPRSTTRKLIPFLKVAAVLAMVLLSNFFVYQYFSKSEPQPVTWHEIVVPRGNRMKITLPDNSSVWLNNETRLKYASDFSAENRMVELSGEAYFDIHPDTDHPFMVKIGDQRIKVMGTKFSVNAYPEDPLVETSLISGSVEFDSNTGMKGKSKFMLEPGYSLFYDKKSNTLSQQKIQSSYYQYWENGVYAFKEESFESLAIKIKRIFNVEIIFKDKVLKNKKFTGTIGINDNIFLFMEAIRLTSVEPIEYEYNKNIINVKLK